MLALAGLFVYLRVGSELNGAIDDGLESRSADLAGLVARAGDRPPELSGGLFESEEGFAQVLAPGGRVVSSTLAPATGAALERADVRRAAREPVRVDGRDIAGLDGEARILARRAGRYVVVAGASTGDRQEALAGIAGAFLIGAPLALLLASGLGYLLAARALTPVETMRSKADEITLERSGDRLPLPAARDELRRLGETLNEMLDRLERSLERERVFVADASHELRTPLSILKAELELADRPATTPAELRAAVGSAGEEVDRLARLADDLLVVARLDQDRLALDRKRVDVAALLERVADRFRRRAADHGRDVVVEAPAGLESELDVLRIEQAVGNLIDNSLRHGDGGVVVSARAEGDVVVIEVSDSGPGFPEGFEAEAFERFTRADGARSGGGAGLGLAIVRAVALAHGGRVSAARPGEPMTVRLALPAGASE